MRPDVPLVSTALSGLTLLSPAEEAEGTTNLTRPLDYWQMRIAIVRTPTNFHGLILHQRPALSRPFDLVTLLIRRI